MKEQEQSHMEKTMSLLPQSFTNEKQKLTLAAYLDAKQRSLGLHHRKDSIASFSVVYEVFGDWVLSQMSQV